MKEKSKKSAGDMPGIGCIVRSVQGRDRKRVFAVVSYDSGHRHAPLVVADGVLHTLRSAKHKNPRHVRVVAIPAETDIRDITNAPTDEIIAGICRRYDNFTKK